MNPGNGINPMYVMMGLNMATPLLSQLFAKLTTPKQQPQPQPNPQQRYGGPQYDPYYRGYEDL